MADTVTDSKVARMIEKYSLGEIDDRLEAAWTGEYGSRTSLRDLADRFNRAILAAAFQAAGQTATTHDITSTYHILTSETAGRADQKRKYRDLQQVGLDVDTLLDDFVSHQAMHTFLTKYRNANLPPENQETIDRKIQALERLEGRTEAVTKSKITDLTKTGDVSQHEYEVFVNIQTVCRDCGSNYSTIELLRDGGCTCAQT